TMGMIARQVVRRPMLQVWQLPGREDSNATLAKSLGGRNPFSLFGHMSHGFASMLFPRELRDEQENVHYAYATMLRHPVDRTWSHFQYHKMRPKDPNHRFAEGKTLEQWLKSVEFGRNHMTAFLSGAIPGSWYNEGDPSIPMLPGRPEAPSAALPNPEYEVTEAHYQLALRNLRRMLWVGVQEHYVESLYQLEFLMGIRGEEVFSQRANNQNLHKGSLTDVDRDLIVAQNKYDILLYREAYRMFLEQREILSSRGLVPMNNIAILSGGIRIPTSNHIMLNKPHHLSPLRNPLPNRYPPSHRQKIRAAEPDAGNRPLSAQHDDDNAPKIPNALLGIIFVISLVILIAAVALIVNVVHLLSADLRSPPHSLQRKHAYV
ncbi:MAG: hypothetical protein Q8P67_14815, partial [archaeon]|nr:hypothetical protein [archaeon]